MTEATLVHMADRIQNLTEKVVAHPRRKATELLKIKVELPALECFHNHGVVDVQLLATGGLHDALGHHLAQTHDVWVPLDALEDRCVVHEDQFLLKIGLIILLEVWLLDDLEGIEVFLRG